MSVSFLSSEGTLPHVTAIQLHHHFQQFYRQGFVHPLVHHQKSGGMLVHNGRVPGGSPVPVPSPNSSLSHPESPRSEAADSSSSPPTIMTLQVEEEKDFYARNHDPDQDDEVLSIGGKDDEQMMMDCDSSMSDNNNEAGQRIEENDHSVTKKERKHDTHENNQINGISSSDENDDKAHSPKSQSNFLRCPSASTSTPPASVNNDDLEDSEDDRNSCKDSQSQKSFNNLNSPFTISNLSRRHINMNISPPSSGTMEDLYSHQIRSHNHIFNPFFSGPHPSNYFNPFLNPHNLLLNHDTSSNQSTASSTNNSTSPSPSQSQAQKQHQQQQQTAAVAAAHSLIFSIANILRPDFGLCNTNTTSNNQSPVKRDGAKRHSQQHPQQIPAAGKGAIHHGKSQHGKGSGHREQHKRGNSNASTIPIDLSRPSSAEMISPNSMISMMNMIERGGSTETKIRNKNNSHHYQNKLVNEKPSSKERHHGKVVSPKPAPNLNPEIPPRHNKGNNSKCENNGNNPTNNNIIDSKNGNKEAGGGAATAEEKQKNLWPAWVYCTRYSDRPSSGPRTRRTRKKEKEVDEKRPRTAFTAEQLSRLKKEFDENRYLTEKRRQDLARELKLHENQIKIWFQNKRAKLKKSTGTRGGLALQLMAQGLYNHSTVPPRGPDDLDSDDEDIDEC